MVIFQETLHLTVCSARNLKDADWLPFSKGSDPFCEAICLFFFCGDFLEALLRKLQIFNNKKNATAFFLTFAVGNFS